MKRLSFPPWPFVSDSFEAGRYSPRSVIRFQFCKVDRANGKFYYPRHENDGHTDGDKTIGWGENSFLPACKFRWKETFHEEEEEEGKLCSGFSVNSRILIHSFVSPRRGLGNFSLRLTILDQLGYSSFRKFSRLVDQVFRVVEFCSIIFETLKEWPKEKRKERWILGGNGGLNYSYNNRFLIAVSSRVCNDR